MDDETIPTPEELEDEPHVVPEIPEEEVVDEAGEELPPQEVLE